MTFLHTKESTNFDTLMLAAIKEVEIEQLESMSQVKLKSAVVVNISDEIEELKQKVEKLTAIVKSNSFKGARLKMREKKNLLSDSPCKDDPLKQSKGPTTQLVHSNQVKAPCNAINVTAEAMIAESAQ